MRTSFLWSALLVLASSVAALPALEFRTEGAVWAESVHQQIKPTAAAIAVRTEGGKIWADNAHLLVKPTNTALAAHG
ncbi:hypothetical protein B0H21DRAFT_826450 [Amylocystis lapponica]|nr:hypothetical protein B0H21DRAFT_826450 [Amylocystis lapponica]